MTHPVVHVEIRSKDPERLSRVPWNFGGGPGNRQAAVTTSRQEPVPSTRLWHRALTVKPAKRSSVEVSSLSMKACPTLSTAPVTRIRCPSAIIQVRTGRLPGQAHSWHPAGSIAASD